jgi:hypothetical protein
MKTKIAALILPGTGDLLGKTIHQALVTPSQLVVAVAVGAAAQIAMIDSLYLHMEEWQRFAGNWATIPCSAFGVRAKCLLLARSSVLGETMTAIHETAYPRMRSNLSEKALEELYTPTQDDVAFIEGATKSTVAAFGGMILLKTFQRLGYVLPFDALPPLLIRHLADTMGMLLPHDALQQSEQRRFRESPIPQIRDHCDITAFSDGGRWVLSGALLEAAQSNDMLADLINVGIDSLVKARDELPAFSTLRHAAQKARAQVNDGY